MREARVPLEDLLGRFVEAAPVGIGLLDADLRYVAVNQALADINGFPVEAHLGRTVEEVLPELVPTLRPLYDQVLKGEPVVGIEVEGETPAQPGVPRTWLCSFFPLRLDDGAVAGIGTIAVETTESKRVEGALARSELRYRSLAEAAGEVVWVTDAEGRSVDRQRSWRRYVADLGQRSEEDPFAFLAAVHPDDVEATRAAWARALREGTTYETSFRALRGDGEWRQLDVRGVPVRDHDDRILEWVGTTLDRTDTLALERTREQFIAMAEASADFIAMTDFGGRLLFLNRSAREAMALDEVPEDGADLFPPELLPSVRAAFVEVRRTGRWQGELEVVTRAGTVIPVESSFFLVRDGTTGEPTCFGAISRDIRARRTAEAEREALAARTAAAVLRARQLLALSERLGQALHRQDVAVAVSAACHAALGTTTAALVLHDAEIDVMRYVSMDGYPDDAAERWREFPAALDLPLTRAQRTGVAQYEERFEDLARRFPDVAAQTGSWGFRARASLPLTGAGGTVLGVLALTWDEDRTIEEEERAFLETVASHTAQALERALLFEREHTIAETLQRSLLPERLVAPEGTTVAARYLPGTTGVDVGGDWYDVLGLQDGRAVLVLGDVVGKGLRAASVMGQVRNALRGLALVETRPGRLLDLLDQVVESVPEDTFVTVAAVVIDPAASTATLASAGHLPVVVVDPEGGAELHAGGRGTPLGVRAPVRRPRGEQVLELPAGAVVLLYSDGLVEDRTRSLDEGFAELLAAAGDGVAAGLGPEALCDHVIDRLLAGRPRADDVALLALQLAPAHLATLALHPDAASSGRARRFVGSRLQEWGIEDRADDVVLCASELVTNAVLHAGSTVRLDLSAQRGWIRLEVGDGDGNRLLEPRPPSATAGNGRGLAIVEALSDDWGVADHGAGKVVWCGFSLAGPTARSGPRTGS